MNITCYVDETGTHDKRGLEPGADVAGVVGWLAWDRQWAVFDKLWQRKLGKFGVTAFHYADWNDTRRADDPEWTYYGWSEEKRTRFIDDLIPIARDNTIYGIGAFVSVQDYDRMVPEWLKDITQHPYHFCFEFFFNWLLGTVLEGPPDAPFPEGEQIAVVCDSQLEFKGKALETFGWIKENVDVHHRLGTITFDADDEDYPPLQAADLLAARERKVHSRVIGGREPTIASGGWDDALGARKNLAVAYYDAESLQTAIDDTVQRYRDLGLVQ